MKTACNIFFILLITMIFNSCKDSTPKVVEIPLKNEVKISKTEIDPNATYVKVEFGIEGMTCEMGCAKLIEKKIAKLQGVKSAKVDFKNELAMVEYNEEKVSPKLLKETVKKAGEVYKVMDIKKVESFSGSK